jgi:tetratricopeptide (TPR) repeat protein
LKLGKLKVEESDYSEADRYFQDALRLARDLGHRFLVGTILEEFGRLNLKRQGLDAASELLSEALEVAREIGDLGLVASVMYDLAQVASARGNDDEAHRLAQESVHVFDAIHVGQSETVKQWISRFYMPDIKEKVGTTLTAPLPEGWRADHEFTAEEETSPTGNEYISLVSSDGQASVVCSLRIIDATIDTQRYAPSRAQMLYGEFPGYRELASAETQFLGERTALLRRFEWEPETWAGEKAITIQTYWAQHGHGVAATAMTHTSNFQRYEFQLRGILDGLRLEL